MRNVEPVRIDLASAAQLSELNPGNEKYASAADLSKYYVLIMQGDVSDGVYLVVSENEFESLIEARSFFLLSKAEYTHAQAIDFVEASASA